MRFIGWPPHPHIHSLYQWPHPHSPNKDFQTHHPQQPNQVEVPPESEFMELDIPDDIPDLIDVPEDTVLDFEAWAHNVLRSVLSSVTIYIIDEILWTLLRYANSRLSKVHKEQTKKNIFTLNIEQRN